MWISVSSLKFFVNEGGVWELVGGRIVTRYFCSEFLAQFIEGRTFIPNFFLFRIEGLTFQLSILLIAIVRSRCICFQRLLNVSLWLESPQ